MLTAKEMNEAKLKAKMKRTATIEYHSVMIDSESLYRRFAVIEDDYSSDDVYTYDDDYDKKLTRLLQFIAIGLVR